MLALARLVSDHDGVAPLNEATTIAVTNGAPLRISLFDEIAAAVAVGDAPVEFMVHPRYRRQGRGTAMLTELLRRGETRFWAHGDLPGAHKLAENAGLEAARTLLKLRLDPPIDFDSTVGEGLTIRAFRESDVPTILDINRLAFSEHPEQGAMDLADFDARRSQSWFRPEGLFVAERDGRVAGFHWTKIDNSIGEVYVVGVHPSAHGQGLGTALTAHGLSYLADAGVEAIDLYVEADNHAALAVYRNLGFIELNRDVLYQKRAG